MKSFPEMFWVWVTKQASHFNRTNHQPAWTAWKDCTRKMRNVFPSCGCRDKLPSHITHCQDRGWTSVFKESVESIVIWLEDQQTGPNLVGVIRSYLLAKGTKTAVSLLHPDSPLRMSAHLHDRQGWDNFVEGRICALWVKIWAQEILNSKQTGVVKSL